MSRASPWNSSPWNSSDQKAAGSAGVSPVMSPKSAIELLEDSATVALLVGVASEPSGMTPGTLSGTTLEELLVIGNSGSSLGTTLEEMLLATSPEVELSPVSVTEQELSGVTMFESCGTPAGPALFESEEQEVRIAHATAAVKNGIPIFLNMP